MEPAQQGFCFDEPAKQHASRELSWMELKYRGSLENRIRQIVRSKAARCRKNGTPFALTEEWVYNRLIAHPYCELSGIALYLGPPPRRPDTWSLDRKIPNLGYTTENTRIVSLAVNSFLLDFHHQHPQLLAEIAQGLARGLDEGT